MVKLLHGDCLELMKGIESGSVDMVLTSPPYDNLRNYGNCSPWNFDIFKKLANEIKRVLKDGCVCVWIVNDATIKGSETGTSFKQALYFKEIGLNIYDTMIWEKQSCGSIGSLKRYAQVFEYMFVFSKGIPINVNLIKDHINIERGKTQHGMIRQKNGTTKKTSNYGKRKIGDMSRRFNVWRVNTVISSKERTGHPAQFPIKLASDHIISWSNKGAVVLDPFMGSGTTGVACVNNDRSFIGMEIFDNYFKIAQDRIKKAQTDKEGITCLQLGI